MSTPEIGVQLYSLRRELERDYDSALEAIPAMGISAVELARLGEHSPARWASKLDELGLRVLGAHVRLEELEEAWPRSADFQRSLNNEVLVVPAPQKGWEIAGEVEYQETARRLNQLGARARDDGFVLAYHNHYWEFAPFAEGSGAARCGMDVLLAETDPDLVRWEIDTAWATRGGWDAVELLISQQDRVVMVHAKEYRCADGAEPPMGEGDVDFPRIVELAKQHDWPLVIEYEGEPAPAGVAQSAAYLRTLIEKGQ